MSTNEKPANGQPPEGGEDRIKNLQAEFSRKLGNTEAQLAKVAETNARLLQQIENLNKPAAPAPKTKPLSDLILDDPDEAVKIITKTVKEDVRKEFNERETATQKHNQALTELYTSFPEFADTSHELTKTTLERYGKMSEDEKRDPKALKVAAFESALELGIKPKSKRTDEDSYSLSGGSFGHPVPRGRKSDKLDPAVLETARMFGLDTSKPETVERLKRRAARTDWKRYQSGN
jgi:hypothetical protein